MSAVDTDPRPSLAIRAKPPSPKRLSRKVLLAGALLAGTVIAFALVSGLSDRERRTEASQDTVQAASGPPESIARASANYDAASLPFAAEEGFLADDSSTLQPPEDPVWANASTRDATPAHVSGAGQGASTAPPDPQAIARAAPILFSADGERADAAARDAGDAHLNARLMPPRSRYALQAGHVIPAALVTGLNSDLPGRVIAQVTAPVYDSVTGQHLLIPQGSRLIGTYDNAVRYGDRRILLVWNRLILPSGWSINLEEMAATDPAGAAGLTDRTDHHFGRLGAAIALSAIISVIANESEDDEDQSTLSQSVGDAAAQQAAQTGARIVDRELTVRPSLTVRPGASVRVMVTQDIELRAYR
jgi:type IV secretion system protein VirB10